MNSMIIVAILASLALTEAVSGDCTKQTACSCTYSDGSVVDLSGQETLSSPDPKGTENFYYSPCQNLNVTGACTDLVACGYNALTQNALPLGTLAEAAFVSNGKDLSIQYKNGDSTLTVKLECSAAEEATMSVDDSVTNVYTFTLTSKHACASAPANGSTTTSPSTSTSTSTPSTTKATNATTTPKQTNTTTGTTNSTVTTTPTTVSSTTSSKTTVTTATTNATRSTATTKTSASTKSSAATTKSSAATTKSSAPTASSKSPGTKSTTTHSTTTKHGGASGLSSLAFGTLFVLALVSRKLL